MRTQPAFLEYFGTERSTCKQNIERFLCRFLSSAPSPRGRQNVDRHLPLAERGVREDDHLTPRRVRDHNSQRWCRREKTRRLHAAPVFVVASCAKSARRLRAGSEQPTVPALRAPALDARGGKLDRSIRASREAACLFQLNEERVSIGPR